MPQRCMSSCSEEGTYPLARLSFSDPLVCAQKLTACDSLQDSQGNYNDCMLTLQPVVVRFLQPCLCTELTMLFPLPFSCEHTPIRTYTHRHAPE